MSPKSRFLQDDFTICWHAGEPLAVPISFYESAFAKIAEVSEKYNQQGYCFRHSVQTNATYINDAWCQLFKKHDVYVGVSLDGPAFIHDIHRQNRKGTGSHAATMRGISFLQKHEIDVSIIAVLTEDSLDYPDEIFNFFWDHGLTDVAFNMEETEGIHSQSSLDKLGIEQRYRQFIARFWELVTAKQGEFKLREFESICSLIYADERLENTDMNRPFMAAGVKSVVVSLWSVPDAATSDLMIEFYNNLKTKPNKAQALQQAMLTIMKQHPEPVNWAGFILVGEAE